MDAAALATLARILRARRPAALGTLRGGAPFVSMVLTAAEPDGSAFYILASRLAWHTQDMLADPRVALLLTEEETGGKDPQTLARLSLTGEARPLDPADPSAAAARELYLAAFPAAAPYFQLGDFALYRITPRGGRFVGGFARAFTLTPEDLKRAARL